MPCSLAFEKTLWPTLLAVQTTNTFCTAQRSVMVGPTQQKRRRTSAFCGVFRPWTWADLSVEGRGNLICWWYVDSLIDVFQINICQEHRDFFDTTLPILLFFFKTPNVMIKHWDMLFLPNYARSWVVLVCVCVCHVSTPADAQICDDEISVEFDSTKHAAYAGKVC